MQKYICKKKGKKKVFAYMRMYSLPVHEIYQHLRIFLVLFHLDRVRKDHVQVKHKVLDLENNARRP